MTLPKIRGARSSRTYRTLRRFVGAAGRDPALDPEREIDIRDDGWIVHGRVQRKHFKRVRSRNQIGERHVEQHGDVPSRTGRVDRLNFRRGQEAIAPCAAVEPDR